MRTPPLAIAVLLFVLAAPSASSAMIEVEKTETAAGSHSVIATCPLGTHVVSGGGWSHVVPSSLGQSALNASERAGNGWLATGHIVGSAPFSVTAYAYCAVNDLHFTTFTGEGSGQPRATASATCGGGSAVSGGGAVTATYGEMSAYAKLGNGWRTAADSRFDGGSSGTQSTATRASVNCTPERYVIQKATRSTAIAADRIADITARCPAGTAVVSGGGEAGGTNQDDYAFLYYSQRAVDPQSKKPLGWRIAAASGFFSGTTVTAYAYCVGLPNTTITSVHIKSKKRKATFGFTGRTGEGGPTFQCSLDGKPFRRCTSPKAYTKLKPGQHTFAVRTLDPARRADPTPAKRTFKIKKK